MHEELKIFFTALMFYTRIPCSKWAGNSPEQFLKSVYYLPVIGWLVGATSAAIYVGLSFILPLTICIVLAMLSGVLITGAFHEDGLADVCDAFGGAWEKEKILSIMKNSRVGTFGVLALVFILLLKFFGLSALLDLSSTLNLTSISFIFSIFISGSTLSRFVAITTILTHQYVRENDTNSKSKLQVENKLKWFNLRFMLTGIVGIIPLLLFKSPHVFLLIIPVYLTKVFMIRFFKKWIGGYTGDCLGSIQQVSEVIFYIGLLAIWKFI